MCPEILGIEAYGLFNTIASVLVYLYNFSNFKNKRNLLSNFSLIIMERCSQKNKFKLFANANLWTVVEILLIIVFQHHMIGVFNGTFGKIFQTGANYFGLLSLSPIFLFILFYFISVNPLKQMDLITPAFPLALISIKIACFFHGCCSGFECEWGYYNQQNHNYEFPSQLLEAGLALLIFIFLLLYKKKAKEGTLFPIFFILYSATRFFSEFTRSDQNVLGPFKTYHFLCMAGVIVGIAELFVVLKYSEKIKSLFERNPFPWIQEKNIIHHGKKKNQRKNGNYITNKAVKKNKSSNFRMWALIWILGLIGQIGWNVEGTWFNTFVYEKIDKNPSVITPMLIMSALATTVSIFLFGTLTDRTGNRRRLISSGFIIWGILTACFGMTQFIAESSLSFAIISVILIDMLLSFFATMATEAGYSTWLTDIMNDKNRGQIGAAIAVKSVLGSLLGTIIGGYLVGKENNYIRLFVVFGTIISLLGIVSIFLFSKKDDVQPSVRASFVKQFLSIFDFKVLLKHKELLWVLVSVAVFFIGYNIYQPYLGNYIIQYLGFSADQMGIIQAVPLLLAMLVTLPVSKHINKSKFVEVTIVSLVLGLIGLLCVFSIVPEEIDPTKIFHLRIFAGVFCVGASYIIMLQSTKVWTKNLYPKESKGQFEGLWIIAYGLIPMLLASNIGQAVVRIGGEAVLNELTGRYEYIPNGKVFLVGILISTFSIIPTLMTKKYSKKEMAESCTNTLKTEK